MVGAALGKKLCLELTRIKSYAWSCVIKKICLEHVRKEAMVAEV